MERNICSNHKMGKWEKMDTSNIRVTVGFARIDNNCPEACPLSRSRILSDSIRRVTTARSTARALGGEAGLADHVRHFSLAVRYSGEHSTASWTSRTYRVRSAIPERFEASRRGWPYKLLHHFLLAPKSRTSSPHSPKLNHKYTVSRETITCTYAKKNSKNPKSIEPFLQY